MPETRLSFPQGYEALQGNLKNRIRAAHVKGAGGPPSVRIIICKTRNKVGAEYALRDLRKPVGVAEYRLTEALKRLRERLPTTEELEGDLTKDHLKNTQGGLTHEQR